MRCVLIVFTTTMILWLVAGATSADDDIAGGSSGDGLFVSGAEAEVGTVAGAGEPAHHSAAAGPQIVLGNAACGGADLTQGSGLAATFCPANQVYAEPVLTVGLIRRAFAELKLPAGELVIQPPDGLTLVNFDTNFYTTSTAPIARTVTLLGQRVTLEATPATYHWDFGDGRELSTSEPGAPYPRLDVTHSYLRTGTYRPSLSTTYTGRYRVGGGAWQQIPGTVTIDGAGRPLRAIEAQPKLVGY